MLRESASAEIPRVYSARPKPFVIVSFLGTLLVAEGIFLTLRFNGPEATSGSAWRFVALSQAHLVLRFAIACGAAALLLGGDQLRAWVKQALPERSEPRRAWGWMPAHLLAFAVFYRLTAVVLESDQYALPIPWLWVGLWVLTGIVSVGAAGWLPCRAVPF